MRMSIELRRKLGRGAHYNVRLLIRGDLQTGKTQLWRRLQGLAFAPEIQSSRSLSAARDNLAERPIALLVYARWSVRKPRVPARREHGRQVWPRTVRPRKAGPQPVDPDLERRRPARHIRHELSLD